MWTGTARWHCPAMCGCALDITAQWSKAPDGGESYRHPVPRTITDVQIANVCATHDSLRTAPLPADPYFGSPGYLALPEDRATLTEAERLYAHLFRFSGQLARLDTCGCRVYVAIDRSGAEGPRRLRHTRHTVKCAAHDDDDDTHSDAMGDNDRKNRLLDRASTALGIDRDNIAWSFSGTRRNRVLTVVLRGATTQQRNQAQAWADTNLGVGRVIVLIG